MTIQNDAPNDCLKLLQIDQFNLIRDKDQRHERTQTLTAWLDIDSAHAFAMMGYPSRARDLLALAQDGWTPTDQFDRSDMDHVVAQLYMELGTSTQRNAWPLRPCAHGQTVSPATVRKLAGPSLLCMSRPANRTGLLWPRQRSMKLTTFNRRVHAASLARCMTRSASTNATQSARRLARRITAIHSDT